jgi:hypothetical protein
MTSLMEAAAYELSGPRRSMGAHHETTELKVGVAGSKFVL